MTANRTQSRAAAWSRALVLGLVALASACGDSRSPEDRLYDAFVLVYTNPEGWNKRVAGLARRPGDPIFEELDRTRRRLEEARVVYARSCDPFGDPTSSACRSATEISEVLTNLYTVESGLRTGRGTEGTLDALFGDLAKLQPEKRQAIAKRVRSYFYASPELSGAPGSSR